MQQDLADEIRLKDTEQMPGFDFSQMLIDWQKHHGRHFLPWQNTGDPYRIWISEIMLQQTQVATVIPYYARFIERFPDVASLAAAPLEEVLAQWSGLGYYQRARNLHKCAGIIIADYGGRIPTEPAELEKLPGIGRSTAAAISVFATGKGGARAAILDGNAIRVFSRVFGVTGYAADKKVRDDLWQLAEHLLPDSEIKAYTQGLMDLGATVCTGSRPKCHLCPYADNCIAHRQGRQKELPARRKAKILPERETGMLVLVHRTMILLQKRPLSGIWGGLLSLPEWVGKDPETDAKALPEAVLPFGTIAFKRLLPAFVHTFTHFRLRVYPVLAVLSEVNENGLSDMDGEYVWHELAGIENAPLPSPVRKLLLETDFEVEQE